MTRRDLLATLLRDDAMPAAIVATAPEDIVRACDDEDLSALVYHRICRQPDLTPWVQSVRQTLADDARSQAAEELLLRRELAAVLEALAAENIVPILLKGTALAYTHYDAPSLRRRRDTDLLIRRDQVEATRRVLAGLGYASPPWCKGEVLFCQFPLKKTDAFGVVHALDVHWKISTQPVFADVLSVEEIVAGAKELSALGSPAWVAGPVHALLLACIHPVMHHRNAGAIVWVYDIHLLASRLTAAEIEQFVDLAIARRVAAICAHQLDLAGRLFGTCWPASALARLTAARHREPSAAYLLPDRRWHHELAAGFQALPGWRDRLRLLREVALPNPRYMLDAYGVPADSMRALLLPLLYLHRLVTGAGKVLSGRK
jgi:hypothetical protein